MPKRWDIAIHIERAAPRPVFQQIAEEIIRHVSQGRLKPGAPLPGTRTLALQLGLNRNTVNEAYSELASQGWIETSKGQGTFISHKIPANGSYSRIRQPVNNKEPTPTSKKPSALFLNDGSPDSRLFPMREFARAFGRVSRKIGNSIDAHRLSVRGSERLRVGLAEMLSARRGLSVDSESLLITRGSQHGIFLVGHVLGRRKNAAIAVESPGYVPAWEAFQAAGLKIVEIPVDEDGIDVDAIERYLRKGLTIGALYTTPHHQFPTTVTLKADRRLKLLELSNRFGFWIIEDDYDHDFHFDSKPVLPLASMTTSSKVIYISSLSKLLTPGLRLGYLTAPPQLLEEVIRLRAVVDKVGDPILEEAVAELLSEGEVQRHAHKMRSAYRARRDLFASRLLEKSSGNADFKVPSGGTALWLNLPSSLSYDSFANVLRKKGVVPLNQSLFQKKLNSHRGTRIGYASLDDKEIELATTAISAALKK